MRSEAGQQFKEVFHTALVGVPDLSMLVQLPGTSAIGATSDSEPFFELDGSKHFFPNGGDFVGAARFLATQLGQVGIVLLL